jgi:hypothetical protein
MEVDPDVLSFHRGLPSSVEELVVRSPSVVYDARTFTGSGDSPAPSSHQICTARRSLRCVDRVPYLIAAGLFLAAIPLVYWVSGKYPPASRWLLVYVGAMAVSTVALRAV